MDDPNETETKGTSTATKWLIALTGFLIATVFLLLSWLDELRDGPNAIRKSVRVIYPNGQVVECYAHRVRTSSKSGVSTLYNVIIDGRRLEKLVVGVARVEVGAER